MQIEDRGIIFDATDRPRSERIAFFTSLCPLRSGEMMCGFQVGSAKHASDATIRLCRSRDAGVTWDELPCRFETTVDGTPGSLAAAELVDAAPDRLLLFSTWFDRSDPTRPLFDPETEGILRSKQLVCVSADDGETWGNWTVLSTPGLTGCATTGPVVRWMGGTIAYAFESFKEFDDPRPGRHAAWMLVSRDDGRTFSDPVLVARHPEHKVYYWDQRMCATDRSGEFVALFWTHDLQQKRDLCVHFRRATVDDAIRADSTDAPPIVRGEPIRKTSIFGQIAAPLWLSDGRMLAFVVNRAQPGSMKLWQSHDGGATWPEHECLLKHTHDERAAITQGQADIDFKQYWEDMGKWSFGHPAIRLLPDERVLLAWYAGTPDCMSIHWARADVRN